MFRYMLPVLFLLGLPACPAGAQDFFSISPAKPLAGVADFPLNEPLLSKIENVQNEIQALPEKPDLPEAGYSSDVNVLSKAIARQPQLMAILQRNAISPQDYVTAYMALADALAAAAAENEEQIFDEAHIVSKENLAFGKKYADRIRQLLEHF